MKNQWQKITARKFDLLPIEDIDKGYKKQNDNKHSLSLTKYNFRLGYMQTNAAIIIWNQRSIHSGGGMHRFMVGLFIKKNNQWEHYGIHGVDFFKNTFSKVVYFMKQAEKRLQGE